MNEEPNHIDAYPAQGVISAEAALVTAWSSLENFHRDLVVVGGLAIYFHTCNKVAPIYRPTPTLDVDFGITLAADAGMAAPAGWALSAAGFKEDENGRIFRQSEHGKLFIDFLTEHPPATTGTRHISELNTSICPGITRALHNPLYKQITGTDHYGEERSFSIPVCNFGPLLVLKLNAFAKRTHGKKAKDAYDILTLVRSSETDPEEIIASFAEEKTSENPAMKLALETLQQDFTTADAPGPALAESFYLGPNPDYETGLKLREDLVTVALALIDT